jgi:hypothetical protein
MVAVAGLEASERTLRVAAQFVSLHFGSPPPIPASAGGWATSSPAGRPARLTPPAHPLYGMIAQQARQEFSERSLSDGSEARIQRIVDLVVICPNALIRQTSLFILCS